MAEVQEPTGRSVIDFFWAVIAAIWLGLAALGFPYPYPDDAIMIGPSLGIIEHGLVTNIYLSKAFYPDTIYLFYPPVFSWVLAGWIVLFGKAQASLAVFWATCGTIASIGLGHLLRRLTRQNWPLLAAPVLLFGCIAYTGLRMELLAFATFFAGLALACTARPGFRLMGYWLLFLTPTVAPTFLAFATVAVLALLWRRIGLRELTLAGGGLLAAVIILWLSAHGLLRDLMTTMYEYRNVRVGIGGRDEFERHLVLVIGVFSVMGIAAVGIRRLLLRQPWRSVDVQLPLLLMVGFGLSILSHARPSLWVAYAVASVLLFTLALAESLARFSASALVRRLPRWMASPSFAPLAFISFLAGLNLQYLLSEAVPPLRAGPLAQLKAELAAVPSHRKVIADSRVFSALDYPTDRPMEDAMVRNAWPSYQPDFTRLPPDAVWVMTRSSLLSLSGRGSALGTSSRLHLAFLALAPPALDHEQICVFHPNASVAFATNFDLALQRFCRS